ncbi:MAG: hypothetical protein QM703_18425 [Gemmatales bacterium]
MWKPLRRRHFDLALLLGLTLFGVAYYLSFPQPLWTHTTPCAIGTSGTDMVQLGFAEDDSSIYTGTMSWWLTNQHTPSTIQQWDAATGKLLKSYPFQIPDEDMQLVKKETEPVRFHCWTSDFPNLLYSMISFASSNNKNIFRLYEVSTGACLGDAYVSRKNNDSFSYLMQNPTDGHHLALISTSQGNGQSMVTDLATGQVLRIFDISHRQFLKATTTPGGKYLVVTLVTGLRKWEVEVYRMHTWEKLGRYPLPDGMFQQLAFLDDTHWITRTTISLDKQRYDRELLNCLQFNPDLGTLTPSADHPLHGKVISNDDHGVIQGNYVFTNSWGRSLTQSIPFLAKVEGWLDGLGIKFKRQPIKVQVQVYNIRTGELVKQLSHLPEGYYQLSPQARYLSYALKSKDDNNQDQIALSLYAIPHHLWETTLSWLQWLAWLLVIPWPLRYFVQRHLAPGSSSRETITRQLPH